MFLGASLLYNRVKEDAWKGDCDRDIGTMEYLAKEFCNVINLGIFPLSPAVRKICADKWNLTLGLWVGEARWADVNSDEWGTATTQLRQTVISLTTIATSSNLSKEVTDLDCYMKYSHFKHWHLIIKKFLCVLVGQIKHICHEKSLTIL